MKHVWYHPLSVLCLTMMTLASARGQETLWQLGEADDSSGEFADYQASELEEISIPANAALVSKGLRRSVNPAMEITFELDEVPEHGAMLQFKLLDANRVTPEMAVFANGLMAGMVQLWGTAGGPPDPYKWKKTYQLYLPAEMLSEGENVLRLEAPRPLYHNEDIDTYLWWEWDYLQLNALSKPATEPVHGAVTHMGTTMKKSKGFVIDDELVNLTPVMLEWLGIAHSGNTMRADFWSNQGGNQPGRLALLEKFKDLNMTVITTHLDTRSVQGRVENGELAAADKERLDNFFAAYGTLFQYHEVDNEPGLFNRTKEVSLAIARYVNQIKPNYVKTTAPGWAYKKWATSPAQRLEVERYCQATNGHAYDTTFAQPQEGNLSANLLTYSGVEDGWPKEMVASENGTNDNHTGWDFLKPDQPHASAFDVIMRAHVSATDRFMQHASIFGKSSDKPQDRFGMFQTPDWSNPESLEAWPGIDGEDTRVKTFRRLALAYATHGTPVGYEVINKEQVAGKKVYFRGVDTSTLPPLKGNGHTSDKILLNFVNFEDTEQTLSIRVNLPGGNYEGQRFGPGESYQVSKSKVTLEVGDELVLEETLGPGEAVQYILPGGQGGPDNYAPEVSFVATPARGDSPLTVTFDATTTYDADGDALTYSWDFGDGSTGEGATVEHTYEGEDNQKFTATLTVNDGSESVSQSLVVDVNPLTPDLIVEDIYWSPSNPQPGEAVRLAAKVTNQGTGPTLVNTVIGVNFKVDGTQVAWSDYSDTPLEAGESRVLVTNNSPTDEPTWTLTAEAQEVSAQVDDLNRIGEADDENNTRTEPLTNDGQGENIGTPEGADLIVTAVSWEPASPAEGEAIRFRATVENVGGAATPAGVVIGVNFKVDGQQKVWSDTVRGPLAVGESRVFIANGGKGNEDGTWTFDPEADSVEAQVDDTKKIRELNDSNNRLKVALSGTPPVADDAFPNPNQWYYVESRAYEGERLDTDNCVDNGPVDLANGTNPDKQWRFVSVGDGYYALQNRECLQTWLETDGREVKIRTGGTQGEDSHWKLVEAEPGYYYLKNRLSGEELDADRCDNGETDCFDVDINSGTASDRQWRLIAVETSQEAASRRSARLAAKDRSLVVYPNPVGDVLRMRGISFSQREPEPPKVNGSDATRERTGTVLRILSLTGQTLLRQPLDASGEVNVSTLPPGMYIVRISQPGMPEWQTKIVKQ